MAKGSKVISQLIDWSEREPWRGELEMMLSAHLSDVCSDWDIATFDQLIRQIGDGRFDMVWGFVFEDLVTSEGDHGNMIDAFLNKQGRNIDKHDRIYLQALRDAPLSLLEVVEVKRDRHYLAHDVLNRNHPIKVFEKSATRALKPGTILVTRLVEIDGHTEMTGGALLFTSEQLPELLEALGDRIEDIAEEAANFLENASETLHPEARIDIETVVSELAEDDEAFGGLSVEQVAASASASIFTDFWLDDFLTRAEEVKLSIFADGADALYDVEISMSFKKGVTARKVRTVLDGMTELETLSPTEWQWLDEVNIVLASLTIEARALVGQTDSIDCANDLVALLEPRLFKLLDDPQIRAYPLAPTEEGLKDPAISRLAEILDQVGDDPDLRGRDPEAYRRQQHEMYDVMYRKMLDRPIDTLEDMTPREASRTEHGKEMLLDWLQGMETEAAQGDIAASTYDYGWLWQELGLKRPIN